MKRTALYYSTTNPFFILIGKPAVQIQKYPNNSVSELRLKQLDAINPSMRIDKRREFYTQTWDEKSPV